MGPVFGASCSPGLCRIDDEILGVTQDMWLASVGHVVVSHAPAGGSAVGACDSRLDTAEA